MKTCFAYLSIFWLLGLPGAAAGQALFTFDSLQRGMDQLRKSTVEHLVISGDRTLEKDRRLVDTLRMFLADRLYNQDSSKSWKNFQRTVRHITIRQATWRTLPPELGEFTKLFELTFVNCPYLTLQAINDQLREMDPRSRLYAKCHKELISLSFTDTSLDSLSAFRLEKELLGDLRELRFIRVKKMTAHCENLLAQLHGAYPRLGWLTLEACDLDDRLNLDTLRGFEQLQMVSLARNFLTVVPLVHKNLKSLDLSCNLIRGFRPRDKENELKFLYLDCNLFQYTGLYAIVLDTLYPHLDVLTYECNNVLDTNVQTLARAFERARVANFLSYAPRYVNDFNPALPTCTTCKTYRDEFIAQLLATTQFTTSNREPCQLEYKPDRQRLVWSCFADISSTMLRSKTTYTCRSIAECKRISGTLPTDPWTLEVWFLVEPCDDMSSQPKYLIATLQGLQGIVKEQEMEVVSLRR